MECANDASKSNWECANEQMDDICNDTITTVDGFHGNNFLCNDQTECKSKNIYCTNNINCFVYSTVLDSCVHSKIYEPINGNLYVQCSGARACDPTTIYGPTNRNLTLIAIKQSI